MAYWMSPVLALVKLEKSVAKYCLRHSFPQMTTKSGPSRRSGPLLRRDGAHYIYIYCGLPAHFTLLLALPKFLSLYIFPLHRPSVLLLLYLSTLHPKRIDLYIRDPRGVP